MMMEAVDINGLQALYVEACENHEVCQHRAVQAAFCKMKRLQASNEPLVFELLLDQMTQADVLPVVDLLLMSRRSLIDGVHVILNNSGSALNGLPMLQLLRAADPKLWMVDLKELTLHREVLRSLFHHGLSCQTLDLSFSRVRKLDMTGPFPALQTLKLDYSFSVNNLPEGCFQGMPRLERLSMCGTGVSNLWTTTAALTKLPNLIELRFQMCVCCKGTGPCATVGSSNEFTWSWFCENFGLSGKTLMSDSGPLSPDEYESPDTLRSEFSLTEEEEFTDLFSDEDAAMNYQQSNISSGESTAESDMDFQGEVDDGMPMGVHAEDDVNYHGDIECEHEAPLAVTGGVDVVNPNLVNGFLSMTGTLDNEQISNNSFILEREGLEDEVQQSMESFRMSPQSVDNETGEPEEGLDDLMGAFNGSSTNTFNSPVSDGSVRPTIRARPGGEGSSGDEQQRSFGTSRTAITLRFSGARRTPICLQKYYREFMISSLPGLKVLDNVQVTESERVKAWKVYVEHFERLANNRRLSENVVEVLRRREIGGGVFGTPTSQKRRLGMVVSDHNAAAGRRSLCAAKLASCTWPATTPICRLRRSNLDMNRKCKPRQFEYHPTEPSCMVYGTLHGEVVVLNHESDKVVGYVQSVGGPHSILGLCWLNKDPNKLIAGSDNGSLQLYDVNHMHATMVTAGGSSSSVGYTRNPHIWGSQSTHRGWSRGPAIYSYDVFEQLTSVHINSTDDYFLASGYSKHVGLYDLRTGKQIQIFANLHQEHINVVKFAHHSPSVFATSSFDKEIKMWDFRENTTRPFYTVQSNRGNVMVCFSKDDHYLLSSAVDNEVRQYLAVDGRLHTKFDIAPTHSQQNYTRSYYMNGRDYIITGSCEENIVRICCAQTGRHLRDLSLEGRGLKRSLYVQSLRGDPFRDFHFCVLVAYNIHSRSEIVKVNLLASDIQSTECESEPQFMSVTGKGA